MTAAPSHDCAVCDASYYGRGAALQCCSGIVTDGGRPASIDFELVSYVTASRYRQHVIETLGESPGTPSGITAEGDVTMPHVSTALAQLREEGLVELLVPEDTKKGRIYGLTDRGEAAFDAIQGGTVLT